MTVDFRSRFVVPVSAAGIRPFLLLVSVGLRKERAREGIVDMIGGCCLVL